MENAVNAVNNVANNIAKNMAQPPAPIPFPVPNGVQGGIAPSTPATLYFIILLSYLIMMIANRFDMYLREAVIMIMPIMVVGSIAHYFPRELQFPGPGTFAIAFAAAYVMLGIFSIPSELRQKLRNPDEPGNTKAAILVYLVVAASFAIAMYLALQFGKGPFFFKL